MFTVSTHLRSRPVRSETGLALERPGRRPPAPSDAAHRTRVAAWWARPLRVGLLLAVTALLSATVLGRAFGQEVGRAALLGGRVIWGMRSPHRSNAPQRLLINGAVLFVRTATVDAPLERVLAESRQTCLDEMGFFPRAAARLVGGDGVLEEQGDGEGTVACLQGVKLGAAWLQRGHEQPPGTTDLNELGSFRYLYARSEPNGRTAVLSLWSQGPFDVAAMFPAEGDVPGHDDPGLPRPPGSTRMLSVSHGDLVLPLNVYRAPARLRQVGARYAAELRRSGLLVKVPERTQGGPEGGQEQLWTANSDGHTRFVALLESGESTWVVIAPLP